MWPTDDDHDPARRLDTRRDAIAGQVVRYGNVTTRPVTCGTPAGMRLGIWRAEPSGGREAERCARSRALSVTQMEPSGACDNREHATEQCVSNVLAVWVMVATRVRGLHFPCIKGLGIPSDSGPGLSQSCTERGADELRTNALTRSVADVSQLDALVGREAAVASPMC